MKSSETQLTRRRFLLAALAGGAATTAAVTTIPSHKSVKNARTKADRAGSGYQLTEHVRNYYRTAKV